MRPDMAKVIVERPRIGSATRGKPKGYHRTLQRLEHEGLPSREGMKRRHQGQTKSLNEHLGPLRRYLDSQVGRPWNKVFSEICARINRDSAVQDHVRDHVADYVATHVILVDRVPCSADGESYGRPLHQTRWMPWYVCPRSGLLKRVKARVRSRQIRTQAQLIPRFIRVSDTLQCHLIDGAWHLVSLRALPLEAKDRLERDVLLDRPVSEMDTTMAREHYGADVFATAKRRLARRELAQFPIPVDLWR
jgi:hypothetical protein